MTVFDSYARYYDLLYRDKDYIEESDFIRRLIQTHAPNAQSILELGCGTGVHATLLADEGFKIHGVDVSPQMLKFAEDRHSRLNEKMAEKLLFTEGDIRKIRLDEKFDVVLSLFHVISYQTTNADLSAAFETVKNHLEPDGIFIFDFWYGPAVLNERPTFKEKRMEDETLVIKRVSEPEIFPNENRVDVNYSIFIKNKTSGSTDEIRETHKMRYLFNSDLDFLNEKSKMKTIDSREWMTDKEIGFDTFNVYRIVSHEV